MEWHAKIDKLIFINLDYRTDRYNELLQQLHNISFPQEKIMRFSALQGSSGPVGCCLSHAAVLKKAHEMNLNNVLILEDDCNFIEDVDNINKTMNYFFNTIAPLGWDAFLFHCGNINIDRIDDIMNRCLSSSNAVAYLVTNKIMLDLANLIQEGAELLHQTGAHWLYQNDVVWDKQMSVSQWYSPNESLCYQRPSYSDLSEEVVDHRYPV
ncbi:MAG TPA: glycosyltransferase family 25 protein [Candidatus Saccharimonadales bacterium]|nr:glycosyltransferase family 25 protein [Candidatus Saccharimonadales bacterium]